MASAETQNQPGPSRVNIAEVAASAGVVVQEGPWERVSRSVARVSSLGLTASLALHVLISTLALLVGFSIGAPGNGAGGGEGLPGVEYALTSEARLAGESGAMIEASSPVASNDQVPDVDTPGLSDGAGGMDEPASGDGLGTIAEGLGGAGGGGIGDGKGLGGGGGSGGASFFGVEARGARFLYICDISGSMAEPGGPEGQTRLTYLKAELARSLRGLLDHMSFSVIFFNSGAVPLSTEKKWIVANAVGKKYATDQIGSVVSFGGTEPWPAFDLAFDIRPAPDAIYFMTDGQFNPDVAMQIQQRNVGSKKIPIHCITLIEKSGEEMMRKIASDSGGTYTHISGSGRSGGAGGGGGRP